MEATLGKEGHNLAPFDVVSCMFALHNAPDLEQTAASFGSLLLPGGQFIAITVDERELEKLRKGGVPSWTNGLVTIDWTEDAKGDKGSRPSYVFSFGQGVDKCREYVVPWKELERAAFIHGGMTCKLRHNVGRWYRAQMEAGNCDRLRMPVISDKRELEVLDLYVMCHFVKLP